MASPFPRVSPTLITLTAALIIGAPVLLIVPPWAASGSMVALATALIIAYRLERRLWKRDRDELIQAWSRVEAEAKQAAQTAPPRFLPAEQDKTMAAPSPLQIEPPPLPQVSRPLEPALSQSVLRPTDAFRFLEAASLAGLSLKVTEEFAHGQIQAVLGGFRSLETLSASIESDVGRTFRDLLDPKAPESLGTIGSASQAIAGQLNEFFVSLGSLREQVQGYLGNNAKELTRVHDMAGTIEEFFESIRMISLNLSIEASRIGTNSGGKALQVLAQRLREFSNQAQEISAQQREVIHAAEAIMAGSGTDLHKKFSEVESQVPPIQRKLDTFPTIVGTVQQRFDAVLDSLASLSKAIRTQLQGEIGQLQFQDLTRQEHEHLAAFLLELAKRGAEGIHRPGEEALNEERLALARVFNERITTSNEREVLLAWLDRHGLDRTLVDVKGSDRKAGHVEIF